MAYVKNPDEPRCGTCQNFYQHYILTATGRYVNCYCGHCGKYPRKRKTAHTVACERFLEKSHPMKFKRKRSRTRYF